jgi:acyl-CoA synthetase (AMP-forming)/AMP-acid ligase II
MKTVLYGRKATKTFLYVDEAGQDDAAQFFKDSEAAKGYYRATVRVDGINRKGAHGDARADARFMGGRVAKWWLPDDVVFVEEIPHTATGKIQKTELRKRFADYSLPGLNTDQARPVG